MGDLLAFPVPAPSNASGSVPRAPDRSPVHGRPAPVEPEPLWREVVGAQLRAERLRQDRTLVDVSGASGISTPYLSEVERGLKEPSSEVLGAIHGALGLRLVDVTARVTVVLGRVPPGPLAMAG